MKRIAGIALLLISALPTTGSAHSQLFLKAQLSIAATDEGDIGEIRNIWRFEPASSAAILKEFDRNTNGALEDDERKELAKTIQDVASPFTIETHLIHNGRPVPLNRPGAVRVDFLGKELVITFSVRPQPQSRVEGRIALWTDDPKQNSVIDYRSDADLRSSGIVFELCQRHVVRPDAASPSRNQAMATDMFFSDPQARGGLALTSTRLEVDCVK